MADEMLTAYERESLLIRLQKEFAFARATIPAAIEADGERIPLKRLVAGMAQRRGRLAAGDAGTVDRLVPVLRRLRRDTVARLSREEMTRSRALELYETARGLDRALDTLQCATLPPGPSITEEARRAKLDEGRRWMRLIRRAYSRDGGGRPGG